MERIEFPLTVDSINKYMKSKCVNQVIDRLGPPCDSRFFDFGDIIMPAEYKIYFVHEIVSDGWNPLAYFDDVPKVWTNVYNNILVVDEIERTAMIRYS